MISFHLKPESTERWNKLCASTGIPVRSMWTLTEINSAPTFEREVLRKLLVPSIVQSMFSIYAGDLVLEIRDNALEFLSLELRKGERASWSNQVAIFYRNGNFHALNLLKNWEVAHPDLLKRSFSEEETQLLTALGFFGTGTPVEDPVGSLFHFDTSRRDTDLIIEHVPGGLPEFPKSQEAIALERAPSHFWEKTWSQILTARESTVTTQAGPSQKEIGFLLDVGFSGPPMKYPASGGFYDVRVFVNLRDRGLYAYDPRTHSLVLSGPSLYRNSETALLFVADPSRWRKKYRFIPYRLSLLDTGVMYQQTALAVSLVGLQGRAIGSGLGHFGSLQVIGAYELFTAP